MEIGRERTLLHTFIAKEVILGENKNADEIFASWKKYCSDNDILLIDIKHISSNKGISQALKFSNLKQHIRNFADIGYGRTSEIAIFIYNKKVAKLRSDNVDDYDELQNLLIVCEILNEIYFRYGGNFSVETFEKIFNLFMCKYTPKIVDIKSYIVAIIGIYFKLDSGYIGRDLHNVALHYLKDEVFEIYNSNNDWITTKMDLIPIKRLTLDIDNVDMMIPTNYAGIENNVVDISFESFRRDFVNKVPNNLCNNPKKLQEFCELNGHKIYEFRASKQGLYGFAHSNGEFYLQVSAIGDSRNRNSLYLYIKIPKI